jgi:hypothetical protein
MKPDLESRPAGHASTLFLARVAGPLLAFGCLLAAGPTPVMAAADTGVSGSLYTVQGVGLEGGKVTVRSEATGDVLARTYSDEEGQFRVSLLPPGLVALTVECPGCILMVHPHVAVALGESTEVNFILEKEDTTPDAIDGPRSHVDSSPPRLSGGTSRDRLQVRQEGRPDIDVEVSPHAFHGQAGGQPVDLSIAGAHLTGHLAGEPISLWMRGRQAHGTIAGSDVAFFLNDTPTGHLLRGVSLGTTVRFEESIGSISWLPSCQTALVRLPRRERDVVVYQGGCATGRRMRLELPTTVADLAPLPRLILLALLLVEREEPGARQLFAAPRVGQNAGVAR